MSKEQKCSVCGKTVDKCGKLTKSAHSPKWYCREHDPYKLKKKR